jgi:hypothetical protein
MTASLGSRRPLLDCDNSKGVFVTRDFYSHDLVSRDEREMKEPLCSYLVERFFAETYVVLTQTMIQSMFNGAQLARNQK